MYSTRDLNKGNVKMSEEKKGRTALCCGIIIIFAAIGNFIGYFEDPDAEGAKGDLTFSIVVFSIIGTIILFFIVSFLNQRNGQFSGRKYSKPDSYSKSEEYAPEFQYGREEHNQNEGLLKKMKGKKEKNQKRVESLFGGGNPGSHVVIKNSNIVVDSSNVNIGTNPVMTERDAYQAEMQDWICENCGAENAGEAVICEKCGERNKNDSNLVSRVIQHEKFRKKFKKFKQQHPDLVKKFTQILKHEVEMMISPSGEVKIDDNDVPDISAEEIIRMSMSLGMSCDEVLDMMIEQSEDYDY
jgi:ribosomal protein L40E